MGAAAGAALIAAGCEEDSADGDPISTELAPPRDRAEAAYRKRVDAAASHRRKGLPEHQTNRDADRSPPGVALFTKGLPHDERGLVDPDALAALERAVARNDFEAVERVPLGGERRFVNPVGAHGFSAAGPDSAQVKIAAPPAFDSGELAAEMVELYWMALARDVPFRAYEDDPLIAAASEELSRQDGYQGPTRDRRVTAGTVFRGPREGDLEGPYVSQFLWRRVPAGALLTEQRVRAYLPGFDFLTTRDDWLRSQNGRPSQRPSPATPRFVHTLRDLATYVHRDYSFQLFLHAALILLAQSDDNDPIDRTIPFAEGNPYPRTRGQGPFATLGQPHVLEVLGLAAGSALRAAWFQKWLVHWRIRPEEVGGRIDDHLGDRAEYSLHRSLLGASVLDRVHSRIGSYLLPQAYVDGCPLHPAYPSGHATIAGACTTVLKAFFDGDRELDENVVASADGLVLEYYPGRLTVGGELDKLATNVAYGRNAAGIHYRSDGEGGLRLGETIAVGILEDVKASLPEAETDFALTSFDGDRIAIR